MYSFRGSPDPIFTCHGIFLTPQPLSRERLYGRLAAKTPRRRLRPLIGDCVCPHTRADCLIPPNSLRSSFYLRLAHHENVRVSRYRGCNIVFAALRR